MGYGGFVEKCYYGASITLQDPLSFGASVSQTGMFENLSIIVIGLERSIKFTLWEGRHFSRGMVTSSVTGHKYRILK